MKPRNPIYLGDHNLEPPDDDEPITKDCDRCSGDGSVWHRMNSVFIDCPRCQGSGQVELTDAERRQKAFDDFDPPDDGGWQ